MKIYRLRVNLPTFFAGALASLGEDGNLYFIGYADQDLDEREKNRHWKKDVIMYHKKTIAEWGILDPETGWFEEIPSNTIKRFWPFPKCRYFFIGDMGVDWDIWMDTEADIARKSMGNCFLTEEEATMAWGKIKGLVALKNLGVKVRSIEVGNIKVKGDFDAYGKVILSYPKEYYKKVEEHLGALLGVKNEAQK